MNIEDFVRNDLFNWEQYDAPTFYDPYRNKNILKDSNKPA